MPDIHPPRLDSVSDGSRLVRRRYPLLGRGTTLSHKPIAPRNFHGRVEKKTAQQFYEKSFGCL